MAKKSGAILSCCFNRNVQESYQKILQEGDYTEGKKRGARKDSEYLLDSDNRDLSSLEFLHDAVVQKMDCVASSWGVEWCDCGCLQYDLQ